MGDDFQIEDNWQKQRNALHALGIISWILSFAGLCPVSFLPASIAYLGARKGKMTRALYYIENYYTLIGAFILSFVKLIVALAFDVSNTVYVLLIVSASLGFTGMVLHLGLRKLAMEYAVHMHEELVKEKEDIEEDDVHSFWFPF